SNRSWDPAWEAVFQSQEWGKYPPEYVIRWAARHFYKAPDRKAVRILDLGSGPGACAWYLSREGFSVEAIDGSATAIAKLQARLVEPGGFVEITDGPLTGKGFAKFMGRAEVDTLYAPFTDCHVETTAWTADDMARTIELWVVTCRKPA